MTFILLVPVIIYFSGLYVFRSKRKHLLLMLLRLEFIVLSLYFYLFIYLNFFNFEVYVSIIFLTISVCERALGLGVLVSIIRTHGRDYFQTFNVLW